MNDALLSFRVGLIGPPCEGPCAVLEELFLPVIVLRGMDAELVAQVGDRHALDQVTANHRHLLLGGKLFAGGHRELLGVS